MNRATLGQCVLVVDLLAGFSVCAGGEPPASVAETIARITSQPRYRHSTWGLSFIDRASGKALLEQSSDKLFVPGSIVKTFSTATVLDSYGTDYRFRTPVYHTGALNRGVLEGDLVLVASGDLSLGLRERPDGTLAFNSAPEFDHTYANTGLAGPALVRGDPFAGLNQLAQEVGDAGVREIRGNVVIDDRLFTPFSGWPDGLISPIWVNENRIDITITPADPGKPAAVDWRPKTAACTIESEVKTVAHGRETTLNVDAPEPGVFRIRGQIAAGHSYGAVFRRGLPVLGVDGTLAQTQVGSPAAGHVQAKTGSRAGVTPADQVLITALTLVGYAEAKSGRPLVFAIMVRDVPVPSPQEIITVDADPRRARRGDPTGVLSATAAALLQTHLALEEADLCNDSILL